MSARVVNKLTTHIKLLRTLAQNPKFWVVFAVDALLIVLAHYLAYAIRFETILQGETVRQFAGLLPLILGIKLPSFYLFGLYRGMWRYTSINDIINIFFATLFSSALIILWLLFSHRFLGYSRSVFLLDTVFTFGCIACHRVSIRFFYLHRGGGHDTFAPETGLEQKRLLLVGAGDAADRVLRELLHNGSLH